MKNLLAILAATLIGCASTPPPPPPPPPPAPAPVIVEPVSWSGELAANSGFRGARGGVAVRTSPGGTAATIAYGEIPGQTGTVRPWHIHRGSCGNDQGIVGQASAYPPLRPGSGGTATASATVTPELMRTGSYFVNVHQSPTELGTIVACANLRPGM